MAIKVQASFSAGELDPALFERTTLEKYDSGLKTARNVTIGKTGRIVSRYSRRNMVKTKTDNKKTIIYYVPQTGWYLEFGDSYVRQYIVDPTIKGVGSVASYVGEFPTIYVDADLPKLRFDTRAYKDSGNEFFATYVFCEGKVPYIVTTSVIGSVVVNAATFTPLTAPGTISLLGTATGYDVDYAISAVVNGEETAFFNATTFWKYPNAGQKTTITTSYNTAGTTEIRVYRRPQNAGAFGFIGSTSYKHAGTGVHAGNTAWEFDDIGQAADYTHQPPSDVTSWTSLGGSSAAILNPKTGIFYQQRLLMSSNEAIFSSRTGYYSNYQRDYPINSASSLQFKAGSGNAKVLHMIDSDGLIVFTTRGVYLSSGELAPDNLALQSKGGWVIDDAIPPHKLPDGVVFVDTSTNSVRILQYSTEYSRFKAPELSAYSSHLFTAKKVTSLAYQSGDLPCLYASFNDGTFASLTYEEDQQMRAWTRHDSDSNIIVEQIIATDIPNKTLFLVNRNGVRYVEMTVPRYVSAAVQALDSEAAIGEAVAGMDSLVTFRTLLNDSLGASQVFAITPVVAGVWSGALTLTSGSTAIFTVGTYGAIGTVIRYFDADLAFYDLTVTARASDFSVTVMPNQEFPSTVVAPRLYKTFTQVTGLGHMELEYPAVVVDGGVTASPNNDSDASYASLRVISGVVTLPAGMRGAVIHVGRAVTYDTETLDIATVEQRPTLIESKTLNKLYVRVLKTRGLYVGNEFPLLNKIAGMLDMDETQVAYNQNIAGPVMGNIAEKPYSRRIPMTIPGDWRSQGRACIRQVDPLHFEILSIIPDLEDLRR